MSVSIKDLCVVQFWSKHLTDELKAWKETTPVAYAESCNRQVWYGEARHFVDFPASESRDIKFLKGTEAYAFLLKLVTGFDSQKLGESNIKAQFLQGWKKFCEGFPEEWRALDTLVQGLQADSRFIQNEICTGFRHHRHELAAKDLSGHQRGENVLLIGSMNNQGVMSGFTDGIARVIGNCRKGRVNCPVITVTHPDEDIAEKLKIELQQLKKDGILASEIKAVPFSLLAEEIEKSPRTFVDLPMNQNPEADRLIIECWKGRVCTEGTLTHLRGEPLNRGNSNALWETASLKSYISPEAVRAEMADRARVNQELLRRAEDAYELFAGMRERGQRPSRKNIAHTGLIPVAI